MRVLVTGHRGYIGSVLVGVLRNGRFDVAGLDCGFYEGCDFGRVRNQIPAFEMDLRDLEFTDLLSFDAVVHLAELPPYQSAATSTNPHDVLPPVIDERNVETTVRLAKCCKRAKVTRLLFASSGAVYGDALSGLRSGSRFRLLTEDTPPRPTDVHGATKLRCEQELSRLADSTFTPIILRNAVVYGVAPRLRLDDPTSSSQSGLANEFSAAALVTDQVTLQTSGKAWRPVLHVEDLARAYSAVLRAPDEAFRGGRRAGLGAGNNILNAVDSTQNFRITAIADAVCEAASAARLGLPECRWVSSATRFEESDYRLDGGRLRRVCPKLAFRWNLERGVRQLRTAMLGAGFTYADWRSDRFRRRARLETLLERGLLSDDLRRVDGQTLELWPRTNRDGPSGVARSGWTGKWPVGGCSPDVVVEDFGNGTKPALGA
ncbi:MAG: SDR family oxidoreductase [Phycisphaerae bacterium]|jgi:nucleoside-diphosphate-sugar epimerase